MFTLMNIRVGEELFVNYSKRYSLEFSTTHIFTKHRMNLELAKVGCMKAILGRKADKAS